MRVFHSLTLNVFFCRKIRAGPIKSVQDFVCWCLGLGVFFFVLVCFFFILCAMLKYCMMKACANERSL